MRIKLTHEEARVLGALIEKEITTPEQYPLSLNALITACNQKSNREPVLDWDEGKVRAIADQLIKKRLVKENTGFGSRVVKFKHWFCNTEFGDLKLSSQELGILCVLFLRGPQTSGELRTRTNRLCEFADGFAVDVALNGLMRRVDGPFIKKLPREPGKRESRYEHLFYDAATTDQSIGNAEVALSGRHHHQESDEVDDTQSIAPAHWSSANVTPQSHAATERSADARILDLENQVASLQADINIMKEKLADLLS